MSPADDTPRERLARLETKVEHLEETLAKMDKKLTELHEILLHAKGAKWVIVGTATIASAVTAFIVKLVPFLNYWPK